MALFDQWLYRKLITVESDEVTANLVDFPVLLSVASDTDLRDKARADAHDIRITEADGETLVSYEIEHWDNSTGELHLWFKAPSLSSGIDTLFYLYYGYAAAGKGSHAPDVWDNDFALVAHMKDEDTRLGFYNNGKDYPFHAPTINPAAYYYNGKTYIAWQGPGQDPYITTFTHAGSTWAAPVKVGTSPITDDHHGAPAVIVDNSGTIHVLFGSHSSPFEYCTSTNPEDISAWTVETDVGARTAYANLVKIDDGTIYLFYRDGWSGSQLRTAYRTSSDGFSAVRYIIDLTETQDTCYTSRFVHDSVNDYIWVAWYWLDDDAGPLRKNIYAAYLDLGDDKMYAADGTDLGATIDDSEMASNCLIVDTATGGYESQTPSLTLDASGDPHIICGRDTATGWEYQYVYWTGSAWSSPQTIVQSNTSYTWGDLYFQGSDIEAYLPIQNAALITAQSMEHWRLSSGAWTRVGYVLGPGDHLYRRGGYNFSHAVVDGLDALRVVFCSWSLNNYTITNHEVFAIDSTDTFLNDGATGLNTVRDSSGNMAMADKKGAAEPNEVTSGQVEYAQDFDGANDFMAWGDSTTVDQTPVSPTDTVTVEAWIKEAATAELKTILDRGETADGYSMFLDAASRIQLWINAGLAIATGTTVLDDNAWHYVMGTYDKDAGGVTEVKVYVDGNTTPEGTADYAAAIDYTPEPRRSIGALSYASNVVDGLLDELRISTVARTATWMETTYNNISSPGAFIDLGAEEIEGLTINHSPGNLAAWKTGVRIVSP